MRLRCRHKLCKLQLLCFWAVLILVVMMVAFMDPLFSDLSKNAPRSYHRIREPDPPDLEVILDSSDPAGREGVLSSLTSLKDDQLLIVPPTLGRNQAQQKKGSYRVVMSGVNKDAGFQLPTHGDLGKPVGLKLEGPEKGIEETGREKYGFNEAVSERISFHRRLPEMRHPACLSQRYSASLPPATVVICFHNEAWSTLLRTVHSVLDTAPKNLLREVLLVDDLSQHEHLKALLSNYVSGLEGVRLLRSNRRLGMAGCRMLGAARALGDVLVFLDSHCECHRGWLEPLLGRIAGDRTRVVSPIMDSIDRNTFQYNAAPGLFRGVFNWKLDFHWEALREQEDLNQSIQPIRSPALAGILAVDRHFFQKIGAYDKGMVLWGVENIELSIRVWLCGGSMEVVPCSRVGHLEHRHLPYTSPDDDIVERNKIRVAETWLEDYRKIFYKRDTVAYFIQQSESANCTGRLNLRHQLGCKDFSWYLSNIHPDRYIPQDRPGLSGELYNVGTGYCADYKKGLDPGSGGMDISPCSGNGDQHCELNSLREVRWGPLGQLCFDVRGDRVVLTDCPPKQRTHSRLQWSVTKSGQIVHLLTERCLEAVEGQKALESVTLVQSHKENATRQEGGLYLRPCSSDPRQQWHFEQLVVPRGS